MIRHGNIFKHLTVDNATCTCSKIHCTKT